MKKSSQHLGLISLFLIFSVLLFSAGLSVANEPTDELTVLTDTGMSAVRMYAYPSSEGDLLAHSYYLTRMSEDDLLRLRTETELDFQPIYPYAPLGSCLVNPRATVNSIGYSLYPAQGMFNIDINPTEGLIAFDEAKFAELGYAITGRFPQEANEIAITSYTFELYRLSGVRFADGSTVPEGMLTADEGEYGLLNKNLTGDTSGGPSTYRIVGIIDTEFAFDDPDYRFLRADYTGSQPTYHQIYRAQTKLASDLQNGYHTMTFCTDSLVEVLEAYIPPLDGRLQQYYALSLYADGQKNPYTLHTNYVLTNKHLPELSFFWLGEEKASLTDSEIVLSLDTLLPLKMKSIGFTPLSDNSENAPLNKPIDSLIFIATAPDYFGYEDDMTYEEYKDALFAFLNSHFGLSLSDADWEGVIRAYQEVNLPQFLRESGTLYSDVGSLALFAHSYENYSLLLQSTEEINEMLSTLYGKTLDKLAIPEEEKRGFLAAAVTVLAEKTTGVASFEDIYAEIVYGATANYLEENRDRFVCPELGALREGDLPLEIVGFYIPQSHYEENHILAPRYWQEPAPQDPYAGAIAPVDTDKTADAYQKLLGIQNSTGSGNDLRFNGDPLRAADQVANQNSAITLILHFLGGVCFICATVTAIRLAKDRRKEKEETV